MQTETTPVYSMTITGNTVGELMNRMRGIIGGAENETTTIETKRTTGKVGSKSEQIDMDFGDELDGDGEIDADNTAEIETTFDLKTDIIPAFRAYAKRHDAKAAGKILARFKAKSVNDLKVKDYPKVMEIIG